MASVTLLLFLVCGNLIVNCAWCCECDDFFYFDCKSFSVHELAIGAVILIMGPG